MCLPALSIIHFLSELRRGKASGACSKSQQRKVRSNLLIMDLKEGKCFEGFGNGRSSLLLFQKWQEEAVT